MENTEQLTNSNGTIVGVDVIWDKDHGTENEGWYVRTNYDGGYSEDDVVDAIQDWSRDAADEDLTNVAAKWVANSVTVDYDDEFDEHAIISAIGAITTVRR